MEAVKSKQAQAIFALVLVLFQVLAAFGFAADKFNNFLAGNEVLALGLLSAGIGIIQGWVTSIRTKKLTGAVDAAAKEDATPPAKPTMRSLPLPMIMVCVAGCLALTACSLPSTGGASVSLFPSPSLHVDRASGVTDVRLLPDANNPEMAVVEIRHKSKTGALPYIGFTIDKPSPEEVVARASIKFPAGATPVPFAIPEK